MNEAIVIARDGIAKAELELSLAGAAATLDAPYEQGVQTRLAVYAALGAMKELTAAVEALERRVNDLEYREHRRHGL